MNIVKHIPNTITSMNLLCGVLGVICTFKGNYDTAFILMLAAAACDFFDGLSARLLKAYSDMGKELDSLADMVSFGVLPALMMNRMMTDIHGESFICYIPLLIAVFSALRLAKFNIDERQTDNFIGLATPACAMICGSFAYYAASDPGSMLYSWAGNIFFIPAVSVVLSLLLVSEIPMFSMKFKKSAEQDKIVNRLRICFICVTAAIAVLTMLLGLNWSFIILLAFVSYIMINIISSIFLRRK